MPDPIGVPVLVAGGGPAGLSVALELGMHGVRCLVVEPRAVILHTRPRAKTTSARTMELFRRWGVAAAIRSAAAIPVAWSNRVTFCTTVTGPEITHFDGVFGLDLVDVELTAEAGQQVTQPVIEQVLREQVQRSPAAELLLGWSVIALDEEPGGVLVTLEDGIGAQREVFAEQVVGADGPRSVVRRALGSRYVGAEGGRPNVNISFRSTQLASAIPHPPSLHYWVLNPESPGVVGPLDLAGGWWAISTGTAAIDDDAHAARIVQDLVGADIDVEVMATDPWQARLLLADSYGRQRMHLVGDAAHQNPPWGGHGFNTGVGDAANLAWKLGAVIKGWAPSALLDSYEAERRPVAQATIDVATANMGALPVDLIDPALLARGPAFEGARLRAAGVVQRTKAAEFHSLGLVLGTGYTAAARAQAPDVGTYRPAVVAGARLPHHRQRDGGSLYDCLGPGFTVFGDAADTAAFVGAAASRDLPLTVATGDHLGSIPHPPVVLVRPDQVIAWAGPAGAAEDADRILSAALLGFR